MTGVPHLASYDQAYIHRQTPYPSRCCGTPGQLRIRPWRTTVKQWLHFILPVPFSEWRVFRPERRIWETTSHRSRQTVKVEDTLRRQARVIGFVRAQHIRAGSVLSKGTLRLHASGPCALATNTPAAQPRATPIRPPTTWLRRLPVRRTASLTEAVSQWRPRLVQRQYPPELRARPDQSPERIRQRVEAPTAIRIPISRVREVTW